MSFPLFTILFLLNKIQSTTILVPILISGLSAASVMAEYYTTNHPIKITVEDNVVTMFSLFRKASFKLKDIQCANLEKPLGSNDWGARYDIDVRADGKKRSFVLQKQEISNVDELISIILTKSPGLKV